MIEPAPYDPDPVRLIAGFDLAARPIAFASNPGCPAPLNRFSILAAFPVLWVSASNSREPIRVEAEAGGEVLGEFSSLEAAARFAMDVLPLSPDWGRPFSPGGSVPFTGGLAGFLAYEFGARFERMPARELEADCPSLALGLYPSVYVADHGLGRAWWISRARGCSDPTLRRRMLDGFSQFRSRIMSSVFATEGATDPHAPPDSAASKPAADWRAEWTASLEPPAYECAIERIQGYLRDGDIYQANLTVRYRRRAVVDARRLFRLLIRENPAPFAAFLGSPELSILSSSPELLLDLAADGRIETRPIKGTIAVAGGADSAPNEPSGDRLLRSAKDRAEHIMIVDLERNDLGRVCRTGSVHVDPLFSVQKYTGLQHLVSGIRGRLREGLGPCDALAALFPGGSITGAPKIRAMEIIRELEPVPRGVYTGAIGWITPEGEARMNLAIRTLAHRPGLLDLHVGGGIVIDSTAAAEFEECRVKGEAMARAVDFALMAPPTSPVSAANYFAASDSCC